MKIGYPSRLVAISIALALLTSAALAADKVERIGPPLSGVSDKVRQAIDEKGYRVTLHDGWTAEFWFTRKLAIVKQDVSGALYPELSDGEFVGVVNLPKGMMDFRGQKLAGGVYTLRYQLMPQDGNHMGVAPNPDFLLALPAADDSEPKQSYSYKKLVAFSSKSVGGNHPAVIALESAGDAGSVIHTDHNTVVFTVAIVSAAGIHDLGIVVKGSALNEP